MPITVKEDWSGDALSYGKDGGSEGLMFNIHGAASKYEAWAALADYSPAIYLGLIRSNIEVDQVGPKFFKGKVRYTTVGPAGGETAVGATPPENHAAPANATEPLGVGYEFNFVAEMTHRTQSLSTRYKRKIGDALNIAGNAPDYQRAVGVSKSGANMKIDGYDAPEPTHTWTRTVPVNPMTLQYRNTIRSLIGKKNSAPFYAAAAGETVLWGVSGRHVDGFLWSLTFTFHERQNIKNLVLRPGALIVGIPPILPDDPNNPGALVVPAASGWDHIWVVYEEEVADNELLKRPVYAYVEKIVEDGNFAQLRIGQ